MNRALVALAVAAIPIMLSSTGTAVAGTTRTDADMIAADAKPALATSHSAAYDPLEDERGMLIDTPTEDSREGTKEIICNPETVADNPCDSTHPLPRMQQ